MAYGDTARLQNVIQTRLAEFLGCRWVALYPTVSEALYELQELVLSASFAHQIIAFCDERSEQYSLLTSIMGSHPVDRVQRVGPRSYAHVEVPHEREPELLWWESVPYPEILHGGVESSLRSYSEEPIQLTDVTLAPLATHLLGTDYCVMSDMRGIVGHLGISCAALIGFSPRAGAQPRGEAVSGTSLSTIEDALGTARQRARTRVQNAEKIEQYLNASDFTRTALRPNLERAPWIISIQPEVNARLSRLDSELIGPELGQDASSLALIEHDVDQSEVAGYLLSVGLEAPEIIVDELDRLSI